MTIPGSRGGMRRRRRREAVGLTVSPPSLLLLLFLVLWELPLNVEGADADVAAAAAAPPAAPSTRPPVPVDHDAYPRLIDPAASSSASMDDRDRILIEFDGGLEGSTEVKKGGVARGPVARLVDVLSNVIGAIVGVITRVVGEIYGGFCGVWQALIMFLKDQVDLLMGFAFGLVDPGHKWKTTKAVTGFVDMSLNMTAYPLRWVVSFASSSPLGQCFHATFYPCIKKRPHTLPTYVRCAMRLTSKCGFFDMFFRYRQPIPFGTDTAAPSSFDATDPPAGP